MAFLKRNTSLALLVACAGLQACGPTPLNARQTIAGGLQSEMRKIRHQIEQEVGGASAKKPDQCRVLPLGTRACGGPQSYVVYSTSESDERKIQELARQYSEAEQKYIRVTEAVSTCIHVMPPDVRLENGRCTSTRDQRRPD